VIVFVSRGGTPPEPPGKPATAQPGAGSSTAMGAPPPSGTRDVPTSSKQKVDALKQKARAAEAAGKRDEAVQAYLDAYTIDPEPGTLYSIAEQYEAMKKTHDAIRYFKRYLHEAKDPPDRADIEKRVKQLEDWLAAELEAIGGKGSGGAHVSHARDPHERHDCLCIAANTAKYGTTSLCKKPSPVGCRCEADNTRLCLVPVSADGSCPDPSYNERVNPGKPNAACTGYAIDAVGAGPVQGTWSCTVCMGAPMREFTGVLDKSGPCVGYVSDTGEKVEGRLDCARDRWRY
jgi:hypothetical protein